MSEKITRENRELKFETLQLHVGQESRIRLQMQEQCRSTRHLLMYSATVIMQQHVSDWQMQVTFTDVLQTLQKMFSKNVLQHWRVELQHWQ